MAPQSDDLAFLLAALRTASVETLGTACDVESGRVESMIGWDYAKRVSDNPMVLESPRPATPRRHAGGPRDELRRSRPLRESVANR